MLLGVLVLATVPLTAHAQVEAFAATSGFGAAFGFAQNIGGVSFTQAGSIGNGTAYGLAVSPVGTYSFSQVFTTGPAGAFAQAIGTPFGSTAFVQLASFIGGAASGFATAGP
jgi:hypothetical protein